MTRLHFCMALLGNMLVRGACWLLIVCVAAWLVRGASAARRALVWQVGIAGLAILPMLLLVLPPVHLTAGAAAAPAAGAAQPAAQPQPSSPAIEPRSGSRMRTAEHPEAAATVAASAPLRTPERISSVSNPPNGHSTIVSPGRPGLPVGIVLLALTLLWAAGAAYSLAGLVVSGLLLRRIRRHVTDPPASLRQQVAEAAEMMGIRRKVALLIASEANALCAPATWGWRRPIVILPFAYLQAPETEARAAICHELAHVRRGDWAWLLAAQAAAALYWTVPMVWLLVRALRRETEMACDDMVLTSGVSAPDYAAQILQAAQTMTTRGSRRYQMLAMAHPPVAESRIRAILDPSRSRHQISGSGRLAAAALICLCVPLLSLRAEVALIHGARVDARAFPGSAPPEPAALEVGLGKGKAYTLAAGDPLGGSSASPRIARPEGGALPGADSHGRLQSAKPPVATKTALSGELFQAESSKETLLSSMRIHWGPPKHGIQAGLALDDDRAVYRVGDTIKAQLFWRCASSHPIVFSYADYMRGDFAVEIQTAQGKGLNLLITYFDIPPVKLGSTLKPGEAIWAGAPEIALERDKQKDSEMTALVTNGAYRIRVSNSFEPPDGPAPSAGSHGWLSATTDWIRFSVSTAPALERSHPIRLVAAPAAAVASAAAPSGAIAWGPVSNGLQAGLRIVNPRAAYSPGEAISQDVFVRNATKDRIVVSASGGYEEQGNPVITRADGSAVKVLRYFGMGAMFVVTTDVRPGEAALVARTGVAFQPPVENSDRLQEVAPGLCRSAQGMPLAIAGVGAYDLLQEVHPQATDGKSLGLTLRTGAHHIRIAGAPVPVQKIDHNHFEDLATAPIAWGPRRDGLQAGLIFLEPRSHYLAGERVRVAAIIRNVSSQPIDFWHETAFGSLTPPVLTDAAGKKRSAKSVFETEWRTLHTIRMTGVTFDMTFAPSADGPSSVRRSTIPPGNAVIGYYLTALIVPPAPGRGAQTAHYKISQPVRLGLGAAEQLDTSLETGAMDLEIEEPDR